MFIEVGGARFSTVAFGSGPRTLLTFGAWVFGWELWQGPMEVLSREWRTAGFDQRGSGETVVPPASITLKAMVADVFTVMDALGIDRCVLGVESRGMIVGVLAALSQPERFDGLAVVGGQPSFPPHSAQSAAFLERIRADQAAVVAGLVDRFLPEPDVDHLKRWSRHIGARTDVLASAAAWEAFAGADVRPRLPELTVPTLLIHGAADAAVPLRVAEETAAAIPASKLVVLEGVGHGPTLTRPREVAEAIDMYFVHG